MHNHITQSYMTDGMLNLQNRLLRLRIMVTNHEDRNVYSACPKHVLGSFSCIVKPFANWVPQGSVIHVGSASELMASPVCVREFVHASENPLSRCIQISFKLIQATCDGSHNGVIMCNSLMCCTDAHDATYKCIHIQLHIYGTGLHYRKYCILEAHIHKCVLYGYTDIDICHYSRKYTLSM